MFTAMSQPNPDRVWRQHLETDRLLGVDMVPVAAGRSGGAASHKADAASVSADKPVHSSSPPAVQADVPPVVAEACNVLFAPPPGETLDRGGKLNVLETLDVEHVRQCTRCDLHRSRTNTVFGEGDVDAELMFIGEGPGQNEDQQGRPFVGRAGELLDRMIVAMGLTRERVYIANVVKCRPPNNRTPTGPEVETCFGYLQRQIEVIRPKAIVTLGGPATKQILQTQQGITRLRGTWATYRGITPAIPVMPTFHPAFLLRSYTRENRARVWSDLQKVIAHLDQSRQA